MPLFALLLCKILQSLKVQVYDKTHGPASSSTVNKILVASESYRRCDLQLCDTIPSFKVLCIQFSRAYRRTLELKKQQFKKNEFILSRQYRYCKVCANYLFYMKLHRAFFVCWYLASNFKTHGVKNTMYCIQISKPSHSN